MLRRPPKARALLARLQTRGPLVALRCSAFCLCVGAAAVLSFSALATASPHIFSVLGRLAQRAKTATRAVLCALDVAASLDVAVAVVKSEDSEDFEISICSMKFDL